VSVRFGGLDSVLGTLLLAFLFVLHLLLRFLCGSVSVSFSFFFFSLSLRV